MMVAAKGFLKDMLSNSQIKAKLTATALSMGGTYEKITGGTSADRTLYEKSLTNNSISTKIGYGPDKAETALTTDSRNYWPDALTMSWKYLSDWDYQAGTNPKTFYSSVRIGCATQHLSGDTYAVFAVFVYPTSYESIHRIDN
ncbi:hypothetical protein ACFFHY_12160 [Levilactobacillus acidifarinae]